MITLPPLLESILSLDTVRASARLKNAIGNFCNWKVINQRRRLIDAFTYCSTNNIVRSPELSRELGPFIANPDNYRLLLYIPSEFILSSGWNYTTVLKPITNSCQKLAEERDLIADFTNGDVPQDKPEQSDFTIQIAKLADSHRPFFPSNLQEHLLTLAKTERHIKAPSPLSSILPEWNSEPIDRYINSYLDSVYYDGSPKRIKWLRWEHTRLAKNHLAERISHLFSSFGGPRDQILSILHRHNQSPTAVEVLVDAACRQFKHCSIHDQSSTLNSIRRIRDNYGPSVLAPLKKLYNHSLIFACTLAEFDLTPTNLTKDFIENIDQDTIDRLTDKLNDPELTKIIYPVIIMHGSQVKGYSSADSDLDLAVFIRPGVVDKDRVSQILDAKLGQDVVQYWLIEVGDKLEVKEIDDLNPRYGSGVDAHVFLGGIWSGEESAFIDLYNRFIPGYINCQKPRLKQLYNRQIERYFLQYRLLHRGYEANFLLEHHSRSNIFMDRGYRRLATELFIRYSL